MSHDDDFDDAFPIMPPSDAAKSDELAIQDLSREVTSTGNIRLAAKRLAQSAQAEKLRALKDSRTHAAAAQSYAQWADDPEEAEYLQSTSNLQAQTEHVEDQVLMSDEEEEEKEAMGHMQEVVDGLWVGDLVAANDDDQLEKHGIKNILSALRPSLKFPDKYAVYPLEIDDSADTDLLSHLPSCVAWIKEILDQRQSSRTKGGNGESDESVKRSPDIDTVAQPGKPGGVLVHCQAGMSRSASIVAAYLMTEFDLDPMEAVAMIRDKRPVIEPSATFWYQLGLFYNTDGKVSLKDRSTRQYYMERTTTQFINGDGTAPSVEKMAKYPASPSPSNPPTPKGYARRKIRCKMCRRHLAVREHMMDHILDQAPSVPASRPRTPSGASITSQRASFSSNAGMRFTDVIEEGVGLLTERERRGSQVSDVINPLTGLPRALSRRSSAGAGSNSALSPTATQTLYQRDTANNNNTNNSSTTHPTSRRVYPRNHSEPASTVPPPVLLPTAHSTTSIPGPAPLTQRTLQSADQLNARLPPQLLALRMAGMGGGGANAANAANASASNPSLSPAMTNTSSPVAEKERKDEPSSSTSTNGGAGGAARRMSLLAMTPKDEKEETKLYEKRTSGGEGMYGPPPILVNPKCSGYFVEPLTWMEPVLSKGQVAGKLVCPNEKCGVKIGNFDWAGVQCGCKEWVTPGFCIHRSKVDEVF
ncbi:dual specificity phosphatase 12 [Cryptococcus deuterogattii R265]|uniref:dual specificity phosphatase 12 n=1 Tax=Cryptococcus deuterogattii (strain R265) TaxID=294750 RepID=UPI001935FC95|nr:dual specificity phosphatase 12 [Cryptococcus deuterogattii R265]